MKQTPRSLAIDLLDRIDRTRAFAEPVLDACLGENLLNTQDRHLLTSLVYGTLRMRGHLDWLIRRLYKGNFSSMQEGIRNILRTALYQFLFMDRIPVFALVDEAVELTKMRYPGREKLVNALLRNAVRKAKNDDLSCPDFHKNPVEHIAVVHSHPPWLVRRWIKIYGTSRTLSLCKANNRIPPVTIRVNQLKTTRSALKELLARDGFVVAESVFSPDGLIVTEMPRSLRSTNAAEKGLFVLQDEASQLISYLVAPKAGDKVLDMCCGSGIKTTHLAALMNNEGLIQALDIYPAKLEALNRLSAKMGLSIIKTIQADASTELNDDLQNKFDRILVDAPCSGLGTLRRNPEIKWRLEPRGLLFYSRLQELILNRAASLLRRGGRLVYSTCTVLPEENDHLVQKFLSSHKDFFQIPLSEAESIHPAFIDKAGFFRTAPDQNSGMDGFFAAILIKD
jgi:16S rRNA (cytosine967-C5)-methyltransferase